MNGNIWCIDTEDTDLGYLKPSKVYTHLDESKLTYTCEITLPSITNIMLVMKRLIATADILLYEKGWDGYGHETLSNALESAKRIEFKYTDIPKQLSIDEIRKQFEDDTDIPSQIDWDGEDYMYYGDDPDIKTMLDDTRTRWYSWKRCVVVNNLIKETPVPKKELSCNDCISKSMCDSGAIFDCPVIKEGK